MLDEPALIVSKHGNREFMAELIPGKHLPKVAVGNRSSCHTLKDRPQSNNGVFYLNKRESGQNALGSGNTPFQAPEDEHTLPPD
jgi:hypothetical protein